MRISSNALESLTKFSQNMIRDYKGSYDITGISRPNYVKFLKTAHSYGPDAGAVRLWTWQACSEFGLFPTTDSASKIFVHPSPLNYFTELCSDVFGEEFTTAKIKENVDKTNLLYGGLDNYKGTNVVITNGLNDPWHVLSHLKTHHPTVVPLLISDGIHCEDIHISDNNLNIKIAQRFIEENVDKWIKAVRPRKKRLRSKREVVRKPCSKPAV
ncbi:hypothetical protein OESDEN_21915 [Oesophagostomum dentatum]|uniref:Serine carboxypeptidase S28 n=1 Tax=Oesophagostomum dentatum TaxID=61180 RepID=A0A0B1S0K0_OESDE|nr:hypothetical protein OESDEN_21915 [Oesophagostomum dentatum]